MIRIGDKPKKAILSMHIMFAVIWLGTAVCSLILLVHIQTSTAAASLPAAASILKAFFFGLLIPSAIGCIKTGILLSIFTHWGLTKYYWIMVKWIVSATMIAWLTLFIGRWLHQDAGFSLFNQGMLKLGFGVQIVLLLVLVVVSVFKPWGKVPQIKNRSRKGNVSG